MKKKLFSEIPYLEDGRIVLRKLEPEDADGLRELVNSPAVYRYLPTFLFEKKYEDVTEVIRRLYGECFEESMILGIFADGDFCGLIELYGYDEPDRKVSIGARLLERSWGKGAATGAVRLLLGYLRGETDIEIVTASSMIDNRCSAHVLEKCGFTLTAREDEDWGFGRPTPADKWICRWSAEEEM
ncbi:MAG: GNAT family N-acetyltransferase [Lachnospiraceae bacterium]|nr:GNAT family N-acetyltransferase [Lachnospiraceae bacterium]